MTRTAATFVTSSARTLVARAAAALAVGAVALAPVAAQACNPFEVLFGGCRERPAVRYYEPAPAPRRAEAARAPRSTAASTPRRLASSYLTGGGVSAKQTPLRATATAPVGSLALFAKDPTLRSGDVVVTKTGFKVYRNHRFASIAHNGGALARLEQASLRRPALDYGSVGPDDIRPRRGLIALRKAVHLASN